MERKDNYLLQVQQAQQYFLKYDQQKLIDKLKLKHDDAYLYAKMLSREYRICRKTGSMEAFVDGTWLDANTHGECMTLLDLICDSRPDRYLSCRWKNMGAFGSLFHSGMLESRDSFAEAVQEHPDRFRSACAALDGVPVKMGDICYAMELFDGLSIALQFWEGDEEFPPKVNVLWDENALMYLKYETMWFAVGMLKQRILKQMKNLTE